MAGRCRSSSGGYFHFSAYDIVHWERLSIFLLQLASIFCFSASCRIMSITVVLLYTRYYEFFTFDICIAQITLKVPRPILTKLPQAPKWNLKKHWLMSFFEWNDFRGKRPIHSKQFLTNSIQRWGACRRYWNATISVLKMVRVPLRRRRWATQSQSGTKIIQTSTSSWLI